MTVPADMVTKKIYGDGNDDQVAVCIRMMVSFLWKNLSVQIISIFQFGNSFDPDSPNYKNGYPWV